MTIVYWDFLNGNDSTGDGSAGNPYKTLSKATTGLTGGDEARCAKSPDPATLSGTLTFTDGSASVATSEDLTAVLGAYDFVSLNTAGETWWEISSINSTTITLVVAYRGTGGTGTGYKRGITGSIAGVTVANGTTNNPVHTISASGTSANKLKLTFGWNLTGTPAQDGQTFFFQSNATKGGYGLYGSSKNYIEIDNNRLGLLRYRTGIYGSLSSNWLMTGCICNANSYYGIHGSSSCGNWVIDGCTCIANSNANIFSESLCYNWLITGCICNASSNNGIQGNTCANFSVTNCVCKSNNIGVYLTSCTNWTINITCYNNSNGIYIFGESANIGVYGYLHDESTWNSAVTIANWIGNSHKAISIQESESGGAARNRVYFYGGYTQNNTAEARSGECLQFNPKNATYWIEQSFFVPAAASTARTAKIYLKDDSSFDGTVWLELWFNGVKITGPTEQTMTTSYQEFSIVGAAEDIPVDGVLELKVLVYGTAGCVYADDISYS